MALTMTDLLIILSVACIVYGGGVLVDFFME